MLLMKICVENASDSPPENPRSLPVRGSVTDRNAPGTSPLAACGSIFAQMPAAIAGMTSRAAATIRRAGRSRIRRQ